MATFTFEEQSVIIRFLRLRVMKPIEIHKQLSETWLYGREKCAFVGTTVQRRSRVMYKRREIYLRTLMLEVPDHVYVSGDTYTRSGDSIIKDGRYTFVLFLKILLLC